MKHGVQIVTLSAQTGLWLNPYFGETALQKDITYLSTPCGNHTITDFRGTDKAIHNEA